MYKVTIFQNGKQIGIHWYETELEAKASSFVLHNHPLFGYKTNVEFKRSAFVGYESDEN